MPDEDPEIYNFTILAATLLAKWKLPGFRQHGVIYEVVDRFRYKATLKKQSSRKD